LYLSSTEPPTAGTQAGSWLARGQDLNARIKEALYNWEQVLKPQGDPPYFEYGAAPPFDNGTAAYSDGNAWWLSELSRIAYTRVPPELMLPGTDPLRADYLDRVGIEQLGSIHSAASHVGLFKLKRSTGGRPTLVVCFRGTNTLMQWILNLTTSGKPWFEDNPDDPASVHQGFKFIFDRLWPRVEEAMEGNKYPIFFTGHSLGGALATLAAAKREAVALYTFGAPRVGNAAFAEVVADVVHHRLVYGSDPVPGLLRGSNLRGGIVYQHTGVLHRLHPDGALAIDAEPEVCDHFGLSSERPLRALAAAFRDHHGMNPPQAMMDHSPIQYTNVLVHRLQGAVRPFYPHYGERESVA